MYAVNIIEVNVALFMINGVLAVAIEVIDHANKRTIRAIGV